MKLKAIVLLFSAVLLLAPAYGSAHSVNTETVITSGKEKVKIQVDAVEGDKEKAKLLEAKIESLDGVKNAYVCHKKAQAKVKYDPEVVGLDDITAVIDEAGYAYQVAE